MGTTNRQFRPQVKMKYVNLSSLKTSKKEQAVLNNNLSSIDKRNDVLDSLLYSSYTTTTTASSYTGTTTTTTTAGAYTGNYGDYQKNIFGGRTSTEEKLESEQKANAILRDQVTDYRRVKDLFVSVLTNIHVQMQELDFSDIRTADPFNYRVKRNDLDELMNYVLNMLSNYDTARMRSYEHMREYFEERGLL